MVYLFRMDISSILIYFLEDGIWFQFGGEKAGNAICETLFVHVRTDWTFGKIPLYADIRLGGNLSGRYIHDEFADKHDGEFDELLSSLTIGYRYDFGKRIKLNFGAGVSFHGFRPEYSDFGSWQWKPFAAVRLGIEF